MKTLGFVTAILLACAAGIAQADVVPGNILTNGDFDTDLSTWTGGGAGSMEWTNSTPDGGGMLINGQWESINETSYTFAEEDIGRIFYVSFDAGSLDGTAAGIGLKLRLSQVTNWTQPLSPHLGFDVSPTELNAGMAKYENVEFTANNITVGDRLAIWFDTAGEGVGSGNHVIIDNVSITTTPLTVPGDFDGDGDVDGADFVAWQTHFPTASGAMLADGDADGDGDVDGADFVVWQTNFPFTPGPGVTPVPEPTSGTLFILCGALALVVWQKAVRK